MKIGVTSSTTPLHAACFDVFDIEPTPFDDRLQLPKFLATPNIGANTATIRLEMGHNAVDCLTTNEQALPGGLL